MISKRVVRQFIAAAAVMPWLAEVAIAQEAAGVPDLSGAWGSYRSVGGAGRSSRPAGEIRLTDQAQAARDDYLSITEGTNYSPGNACVGYGMPESVLGSGGYPMEIIQRPEQIVAIYELHNEIRRIYLGDEAGDPAAYFPERNGYSTGHWENDRLIVQTTRLKTQVDSRYPHSDQATIREEYYLDEPFEDGTRVLVNELTMIDPVWLEEPFVVTKRWRELTDYHVLTYECTEPAWLDEMESLYEASGLEMVQQ